MHGAQGRYSLRVAEAQHRFHGGNKQSNIPGYVPVSRAASDLGVTAHQIAALVRLGELEGVYVSKRTLLIDLPSLLRYAQLRRGRGRPLSEKSAFDALGLLSGIRPESLTYQQDRRLRQKLKDIAVEDLVWQTRKRKKTKRYRCSPSFLGEMKGFLVLSGISAAAEYFDLTGGDVALEGYVSSDDLPDLEKKFFLREEANTNVVLHVSSCVPWDVGIMPEAVVAADLAESLNARERTAGLDALGRLLDEYCTL